MPPTVEWGSGSNGLKHKAERFAGGYVANGMLIAAVLALGFSARPTHPDYPNAFFNISSKLATPPDHHADCVRLRGTGFLHLVSF
jgi:hypothetical protein